MARLAHQVGECGVVFAAGGEQAAAQRVAGESFRVEPGIGGGLLDQPRHRLVGQSLAGDPAGLGDGAEQRPLGARGGGGGPVEVGGGAAMRQPGVERRGRAEARLGWVGPDRDALAWPCWSVFERRDGEQEAAAGDGFDVAQAEADEFRAAQRGAETEQQHGAVARAERRGRGGALASISRSMPGTAGAALRRGRNALRGWCRRRSMARPASRCAVRIAVGATRIELTARPDLKQIKEKPMSVSASDGAEKLSALAEELSGNDPELGAKMLLLAAAALAASRATYLEAAREAFEIARKPVD